MAKGTFYPQEHLINLKGKNYLQVAHRVAWFKTEHGEDGAITTDVLQTEPFPLVKAYISIAGAVIATGHGTAQVSNNAVYKGREIEKAETAAIGRALANAGYGTQFSEMLDDDSDDLADSPTQRQPNKPTNGKPPAVSGGGAKAFPNVAAKEAFVKHWDATDGLNEEQLKMILGVKFFNEYTGTLAEANAAVENRNRAAFGAKAKAS